MGDKLQLGALDIETKKYTPPSEATKGREYKCIDCDKRVIFKKGEIKRPHFAHYSQTNVCSYYEHPNEAQIHKDAKLLMQKMLNEKRLFYFKRDCLDCKNDYAFQGMASFDYKQGDEAVLEYRDPNNKWIADVAVINNEQIRCIIEIKNTHKTVTPRPEPWFEVDAKNFINTINELTEETLKDPEEYSFRNEKDYIFEIPCLRKELHPRCYGSFCYYEKWVRRIPGYDKNQSDNTCILCKIEEYTPQWGDSKFQKSEIRVCFDCIRKEFYEKKIRELYSDDKKNTSIINNNIVEIKQPQLTETHINNICRGDCYQQKGKGIYYKKIKCKYNCKLWKCRCSVTMPLRIFEHNNGTCINCVIDVVSYSQKELELLNKIPTLSFKIGSEGKWHQEKRCQECGTNSYNPLYVDKKYYAVCKICFCNDEVQKNILKKINEGIISNKVECMISDD